MKKVVHTASLTLFLLIVFAACSPKYGIYEAKAYLRESHRGVQSVNEANQPVGSTRITENLLFIETRADENLLQVTSAWIEQKPYSVQLQKMQPGTTIGKLKDAEAPAIVIGKEGRQLWQAVVTENSTIQLDSSISSAVRNNPVVLTGTWKGKAFFYAIPSRIALEAILYQ
jgi:hypothetical protein